MSATELAENVESQIHDAHPFDLKKALLVSVTNGSSGVELSLPLESGDIYDLMESKASSELAKRSEFIAVVTCGWAAPLPEDDDEENREVVPSEHPKRRRVRLVILASRTEVTSVLRFADTPDETIIDLGKARGSLADAIQVLMQDSKE